MPDAAVHLKLPLDDETVAAIQSIIADSKDPDITPGRWCFRQIAAKVKENATLYNKIRFNHRLILGDKTVRMEDLRTTPLESYPEGSVDVLLDRPQIEGAQRACAVLEAVQRVTQSPPVPWGSPREWCLNVVEDAVSNAVTEREKAEMDDSEKAIYDPPKKEP